MDIRQHGIERIARRKILHAIAARLHKRAGRQGQQFIRAIAHDHIFRLHTMQLGQAHSQSLRRGIGIQPQPIVHRRLRRRQHLGRRRIRILVGVKLNQPADLRLFAGHVGMQALHVFANTAHKLIEPDGSRSAVSVQPFHARELFDGLNRFAERGRRVFHHAGTALEHIYCQPRKRRAGAAGWQGVAWTGDIIAGHCRRRIPQEQRACGHDLFRGRSRILDHHLAMFRRQAIGQGDAFGARFHLNQPAVVLEHFADVIRSGTLG